MSRKLFAPLAVVVSLALAACGGNPPAETAAPAETTAPATTTAPADATPPADTMAPAAPAPATP